MGREGRIGGAAAGCIWIDADCVPIQAPEIQTMYSLNISVGELRTKMREQFERHRYVKQLPVVDMLLFQSHAEYQVGTPFFLL